MDNGQTATIDHSTAQAAPTAAKTKKLKGTLVRNPRIVLVSKISALLDGADEETRSFGVRFIAEEYSKYIITEETSE